LGPVAPGLAALALPVCRYISAPTSALRGCGGRSASGTQVLTMRRMCTAGLGATAQSVPTLTGKFTTVVITRCSCRFARCTTPAQAQGVLHLHRSLLASTWQNAHADRQGVQLHGGDRNLSCSALRPLVCRYRSPPKPHSYAAITARPNERGNAPTLAMHRHRMPAQYAATV
jgi:hypothetical protein